MWGFLREHFVTRYCLRWKVVSTSPNTQAGGPPLVDCPQLLIQFIRSYPPYWRPLLHPQPEDAPCHGDRDSLITGYRRIYGCIYHLTSALDRVGGQSNTPLLNPREMTRSRWAQDRIGRVRKISPPLGILGPLYTYKFIMLSGCKAFVSKSRNTTKKEHNVIK
jgi:hypothetical protein